jgi:hypothetical protein
MLENLTKASFDPHLDETFRLVLEPANAFNLELINVEGLAQHGHKRQPFSLVFRAAKEVVLPQRIYQLEHDTMGTLELFLVPIGPDQEGMRYEAVFT